MVASWTFCSRDGFAFVELEPKKPSLYQRYFDWRDNVANVPNNVPASCRLEADLTPRKQVWIEMRDMSSAASNASADALEDKDLETFDTCKCEEEGAGKMARREGLVRDVKSMVEFVSRTLSIGRH